jgi:hypothetical protein
LADFNLDISEEEAASNEKSNRLVPKKPARKYVQKKQGPKLFAIGENILSMPQSSRVAKAEKTEKAEKANKPAKNDIDQMEEDAEEEGSSETKQIVERAPRNRDSVRYRHVFGWIASELWRRDHS